MRLLIISDIHYASSAEQARGDYELNALDNPISRLVLRFYRNYVWLRAPTQKNHLLGKCLDQASHADLLVANGDYSCDSGFIGLADDAAMASAREAIGILRRRYAGRLELVFGDHELGKSSFLGGVGGLRLEGFKRSIHELGLKPFWARQQGQYTLIGVTSSLLALPVFAAEVLPSELEAWEARRHEHLTQIEAFLSTLPAETRIILFCHDPSALPFLWRETGFGQRTSQIEHTIIGHLHTPLVFWKCRRLSGMPRISFLGHTVRRMSTALSQAEDWWRFKVTLCPALAGVELLKDGGWLTLDLDPSGSRPSRITRHWLAR